MLILSDDEDALTDAARLGFTPLTAEPLTFLLCEFTYFWLTIEPTQVSVTKGVTLRNSAPYEWLNWAQVGLAALPAPIKRLLLATRP